MSKEPPATADDKPMKAPASVKVAAAKGRPMLSWVGKRPLREVRAFPAQLIERFSARAGAEGAIGPSARSRTCSAKRSWSFSTDDDEPTTTDWVYLAAFSVVFFIGAWLAVALRLRRTTR